jgi:2-hydroxychromene-2-carboxylate isomerase
VGSERGPNLPEPELLASLACRDAAWVAPHYGLAFPEKPVTPGAAAVERAERVLAAVKPERFADTAVRLGERLWSGDVAGLEQAVAGGELASEAALRGVLAAGQALRRKLGHYSSATFYYAGEWYWGVDRLYHLEARLRDLGVARSGGGQRYPRPAIPMQPVPRAGELSLEVFPSLRSPYTAIGFEKAVELARATGVPLHVRPVLPMVMRGVPVTFRKGIYIFRDTRRESETLGVPFGSFLDPIGRPVRRGYSLWPFARDQGRGAELLAAFLRAAFAEGRDTGSDTGMRHVVERAGLDWQAARPHLDDPAWEPELEANRLAMYEMGLWGVPSFRLQGPAGEPDLALWGQDRLWLLGREIQRRGRLQRLP